MTTYTVLVSKINESVDFDHDQLPESSREFALQYGLTQWLADKHANIKRADFEDESAWLAAVRERTNESVTAIREGRMGVRRSGGMSKAAVIAEFAKSQGFDSTEAFLEHLTTTKVGKRRAA